MRKVSAAVHEQPGTIVIDNLCKTYKKGKRSVQALSNVCLTVQQNEIVCVLGHNGAGKSTLFNCLTGELQPTGGTMSINGHSIPNKQMNKHCGIVTQQNICWADMTIAEHMYFFGRLKGIARRADLRETVGTLLKQVHLEEHARKSVKRLSGGMKRRLMMSMAMIGTNVQYVVLDEPSTGLDVMNRQRLWHIIDAFRHGKAIVLTTHSLEEAETLSSRIAIMSNGRVQCVGTCEQLKRQYGDGHRLNLSINAQFTQLVLQDIQHIGVVDTVVGDSVEVLLPKHGSLATAMQFVQRHKEQGHIKDWAIQQSTLEDVFLKVTRQQHHKHD